MDSLKAAVFIADLYMPNKEEHFLLANENKELYFVALASLARNDEWLEDTLLAGRVIQNLEIFSQKDSETLRKVSFVYQNIIRSKGFELLNELESIQVSISLEKTAQIPKTLLLAASENFQELLSSQEETQGALNHLIDYVCTGNTSFIANENAADFLLLGKKYKMAGLFMKSLEHILSKNKGWKEDALIELKADVETKMEIISLLTAAKKVDLYVSNSPEGMPHITARDGSKEQWECLNALNAFYPIAALKFSTCQDLESLLGFAKANPQIVSLDLGDSEHIDDAYLEELSQHLENLDTFSIYSSPITIIPKAISDRVKRLDCHSCKVNKLHLPEAIDINGTSCTSLDEVYIPKGINVKFNYSSLKKLSAPNGRRVEGGGCKNLETVEAPLAGTVICTYSPRLASVVADEKATVDTRNSPQAKRNHPTLLA